MIKKKYAYVLPKDLSKKKRYYNHRSSFIHKIYRHRTSLSNYLWEIKKKQGIDPISSEYKAGIKYWLLCMEEKIAIASNNNLNELLNQRSEILYVSRH